MIEKIKILIENEDIKKEMGENGRKMALEYTKDKISKKWYEFFEDIIK